MRSRLTVARVCAIGAAEALLAMAPGAYRAGCRNYSSGSAEVSFEYTWSWRELLAFRGTVPKPIKLGWKRQIPSTVGEGVGVGGFPVTPARNRGRGGGSHAC